jgi:protein-arginine kinase activator protein McsA
MGFLFYMKKLDFNTEIEKLDTGYSFDRFIYKDIHSKSIASCPKHGEFETSLARLRKRQRCPKCSKEDKVFSNEEFISKAEKIHNYSYDYSHCNWTDSKCKVKIRCPKHGLFEQFASNHLKRYGCIKCKIERQFDSFVKKSNNIHNNKWNYSKSIYKNNKTAIEIVCQYHGSFWQRPDNHLQGNGCPACKLSKGEIMIVDILNKLNIKHISQKTFDECKSKYKLRFDFWLPEYNTCIEYDGPQHETAIDFFGGISNLEKNIYHDNIKSLFCINNNINLIRISYKLKPNIEEYILGQLKKN